MNDFDYDCMQKKRIARGAFAHISRKRGGCTLPSDLLTAKQRKEKNGEVKSYNISRPMPWCEFKQMPDDLKREFYRNMQSFGGSAKWLAEEMGASDQTIRDSAERCGAPFRRGGRNLEMWQRKLAEWANTDAADVHKADTEELRAAADMAQDTPAPQKGTKRLVLEHARMEFNYSDFSELAVFLRVSVPECGRLVVEW